MVRQPLLGPVERNASSATTLFGECCRPEERDLLCATLHAAAGKGVVELIGAAGIFAVGVGGMYAFGKVRDLIWKRTVRAEQDEWGQNAEQAREAREPRVDGAAEESRKTS